MGVECKIRENESNGSGSRLRWRQRRDEYTRCGVDGITLEDKEEERLAGDSEDDAVEFEAETEKKGRNELLTGDFEGETLFDWLADATFADFARGGYICGTPAVAEGHSADGISLLSPRSSSSATTAFISVCRQSERAMAFPG